MFVFMTRWYFEKLQFLIINLASSFICRIPAKVDIYFLTRNEHGELETQQSRLVQHSQRSPVRFHDNKQTVSCDSLDVVKDRSEVIFFLTKTEVQKRD